ncbi:pyridoxal phosphate-dependent aminotransferase [Paraburkholderia tuberum]|uniref:Aminotransferase n=1 Tax=Paraburkholderia tuberum TaxID=157910 RepID=A0A1H1KHS7_9BURK|nr:pyridoxal phosphate-dependent aminotransferase [Paraburkholderia tuberum]SDR61597.1 aspartate aminotransferase [Paraburkholderia tuberum]
MQVLSEIFNKVKPSPTLAITKRAGDMRREGIDVIGLSQGEPDFPTPEHVNTAAKAAIDGGQTKYTDVDGTRELKEAIARKFQRDNGLSYEVPEISVGTGGKQVIYNALVATLNPGDEVIIPAPYWVSYPDMVRLAGGRPVEVHCPASQDFKLTASQLRDSITQKTKWVVINSPSNPTGAGYSAAELAELAAVLLRHPHVLVLTDDIYEHIRYDGWSFSTIASVEPRLKERTLTVNGVSKAYAMTGWRIGYAGGPRALISAMSTIQSQSTSNPSSIAQAAALAALDGPMEFLAERNEIFKARRDLCLDSLNATAGLSCRRPEGAFYLFVSCEGLLDRATSGSEKLKNDMDVGRYFLEQAKVAVVPGSAFGTPGYFRISFATATERLEEGCRRIREACENLN